MERKTPVFVKITEAVSVTEVVSVTEAVSVTEVVSVAETVSVTGALSVMYGARWTVGHSEACYHLVSLRTKADRSSSPLTNTRFSL